MTTSNNANGGNRKDPVPNSPAKTTAVTSTSEIHAAPSDFIREIVAKDIHSGNHNAIVTRFPPEPNGYLHIGHAKSICLNFGIAREFGGICNLRMDDTNPTKEDTEYVESIIQDVRWLVSGWADHCLGFKAAGSKPKSQTIDGKTDYVLPAQAGNASIGENSIGSETNAAHETGPGRTTATEPFFASDYFDQLFEYAAQLIRNGNAFVCDLSATEMDDYRGAPERPGRESPWRNRTVEENLDLFERMKDGEFPDGLRTLRAKIDMTSPNMWLRDPVIYRIRILDHHHTGSTWRVYPMYDFAHCLSDYIEGITHSICTLEFEVHRPLYDWILEHLNLPRRLPRQYEFARLNLEYTVISKRKLLRLVQEEIVDGWDDPRMPTISGLRRRGVTASSLRNFAQGLGVTKYNGLTDVSLLEHSIREDLNKRALRRLAVLKPVKVIISNYPEIQSTELEAINNPEDPSAGKRRIPFSRVLYIEKEDFMEIPPPKYFRLRPGGEVRLKYAYIIKCNDVVKDPAGDILELHCTADLDSKTGGPTAGRKVKGTIHWVSAEHAVNAEVRLYDRLFRVPEPSAEDDFTAHLNSESLETVIAKCEPSLREAQPDLRYQFERIGYFFMDVESTRTNLVFNRTISLKDAWAKASKKR